MWKSWELATWLSQSQRIHEELQKDHERKYQMKRTYHGLMRTTVGTKITSYIATTSFLIVMLTLKKKKKALF